MSMINLLPWRRERLLRRQRFWGGMFIAALLIPLAVILSYRVRYVMDIRASALMLAGETAMQHELNVRHAQWKTLHEQYQRGQQARLQQGKTQSWQPLLVSLAQSLPEQAWLSQLRYQPSGLVVTGYATTASALKTLSDALRKLPGFAPATTGEIQQDNQGRWTFTFTLVQKE